jgi:hypothetical protein
MIFDDFNGIAAAHARLFATESKNEPTVESEEREKSVGKTYELPVWTTDEILAAEAA